MTGDEFLRALGAEIIEQGDVRLWWQRFSAVFDALDLVGAIDEAAGRELGENVRSALADATGEEVHRFHLVGRARPGDSRPTLMDRMRPVSLAGFTARSAWAPLPETMGAPPVGGVGRRGDREGFRNEGRRRRPPDPGAG